MKKTTAFAWLLLGLWALPPGARAQDQDWSAPVSWTEAESQAAVNESIPEAAAAEVPGPNPYEAAGQMPPPTREDRILLVAAHNDDEAIPAAGYLASAARAGAEVTVVVLTSGDANKFSAFRLSHHLFQGPGDYFYEGRVRQQESIQALGTLGLPRDKVFLMGFPDGGLDKLLGPNWARSSPYTSRFTRASAVPYAEAYRPMTPYTGEDLTALLAEIVGQVKPTVVLTHSARDKHADHRATGEFISRAVAQAGIAEPRRYEFLIHWRRFPRPKAYRPAKVLTPPKDLQDKERWLSFSLPPGDRDLKRSALRSYKSQHRSPFLHRLMEGFVRPNELFIAPPHQGSQNR